MRDRLWATKRSCPRKARSVSRPCTVSPKWPKMGDMASESMRFSSLHAPPAVSFRDWLVPEGCSVWGAEGGQIS